MFGLRTSLYLICSLLHIVICSRMFCHEPSMGVIRPVVTTNHSDFGFSIALQKGRDGKIVIGAPNHDRTGKVFLCELSEIMSNKTSTCNPVDIDVEGLSNYKLAGEPGENFYLGMTIAATSDLFVTCAPLTKFEFGSESKSVYGSCFVYDGSAHQIRGSFEKYLDGSEQKGEIYGGLGSNILIDEANRLLIISKSTYIGDIQYSSLDNATDNVEFIKNKMSEDINLKFKKNSNIGYGLASGNFFDNSTVFEAVSMKNNDLKGQVMFMQYPNLGKQNKLIVNEKTEEHLVEDTSVGTMFGYVMSTADLNVDGIADLLVSAPGYFRGRHAYDLGAVYIYIGGHSILKSNKNHNARTIVGVKEGARFGSSLIAQDLDGDGIPELIIGAPYEDQGLGALYILSGYEVKTKLLTEKGSNIEMMLSAFTETQRIQLSEFKQFGFSLQPLVDVDDNGSTELAVGSPGSAAVVIFRSIPVESVELTIIGQNSFKEQDTSVVLVVCAQIEKRKLATSRKLVVNTAITGEAVVKNPEYLIILTDERKKSCDVVSLELKYKESGNYNFTASIDIAPELKQAMKLNVFDPEWFALDKPSRQKQSKTIQRSCTGDDCLPKLSINLHWLGEKNFDVGLQETENLLVNVRNDGHAVDGACVLLEVNGAQLISAYEKHLNTYTIPLKPLRREAERNVSVTVDMSHINSTDKQLGVIATVYEDCNTKTLHADKDEIEVSYVINADSIVITSLSQERVLSDNDFTSNNNTTVDDVHEYIISNEGTVTWLNENVNLIIDKKPFMTHYEVSMTALDKCNETEQDSQIQFSCKINLRRLDTVKINITISIGKDSMIKNIIENKIITTSYIDLYLGSIKQMKNASVSNKLTYYTENPLKDKKPMIVLISLVVAVVILVITSFVLFKIGFFNRVEKEKTEDLKKTIRRKSLKGYEGSSAVDDVIQNGSDSQTELHINDQLEVVTSLED
ncbi:integrin alpha-IIb-like [Bombyx mandarina]|uniref:Integrin alpha-IIb-like n=1 Tax=Bombyx mandarina TaxID=7092 RepID=A0A6J2K7X4_BOMMA|nr:integrin alpha-IIb-like [Bombyx mandarina]